MSVFFHPAGQHNDNADGKGDKETHDNAAHKELGHPFFRLLPLGHALVAEHVVRNAALLVVGCVELDVLLAEVHFASLELALHSRGFALEDCTVLTVCTAATDCWVDIDAVQIYERGLCTKTDHSKAFLVLRCFIADLLLGSDGFLDLLRSS